jgi:hypothetical protein
MDACNPGQSRQSATRFADVPLVPTFIPHRLTVAVVMAMATLASEGTRGAGSCGPGTTLIGSAVTRPCVLGEGAALSVTANGALRVSSGAAVSATDSAPRQVLNAGRISGADAGVSLSGAHLTGKLYNAVGAEIAGGTVAVHIVDSQVDGGIANSGQLQGALWVERSVINGLNNAGLVTSPDWNVNDGFAITLRDSTVRGDVVNSGRVGPGGDNDFLIDHTRIEGSFRNSGDIQGDGVQLVNGSVITGDLRNDGEVRGESHILGSVIEGAFVNGKSGFMNSSNTALTIGSSTVKGGFINNGEISSDGTYIRDSVLGGFTNTGLLYVSSGNLGIVRSTINGDLRNSGTIGSATGGYGAVYLIGGRVTGNIENTGTLEGGLQGLSLSDGAELGGSLINRGVVNAINGIYLEQAHVHGDLINDGQVTGWDRNYFRDERGLGIIDSTLDGDLLNHGSVLGIARALDITGSALGGDIVNSGQLYSDRAVAVVDRSTVAGRFVNSGVIGPAPDLEDRNPDPAASGLTLSASQLEGVDNSGRINGNLYGLALDNAHLTGQLVNQAGGSISGSAAAIHIVDSQVDGGLVNAGALAGETLIDVQRSTLGRFHNSANLDLVGEYGFRFIDSTVSGDLSNAGNLSQGGTGILVEGTHIQGSLRNSGNLDTADAGLRVSNGSVIDGDLVNTGSVSQRLSLSNSTINGRFLNSASGYIGGTDISLGINHSTLRGGFINNGEIYGGEGMYINDSVLNGFVNTGRIDTSTSDFSLSSTRVEGTIRNTGTLGTRGDGYGGLSLYSGEVTGRVYNVGELQGGTVGTALRLVDQRVNLGIVNSGLIWGSTGIGMNDSQIGELLNTGRIIGNSPPYDNYGTAVRITDSSIAGNLRNAGVISGTSQGLLLSGSTLQGSLINSGEISSPRVAAVLDHSRIDGQLLNLGYVGADRTGDPDLRDNASNGLLITQSTVTGRVENRGTIDGNRVGLRVTGSTLEGGLENRGTLAGRNYSLYVDSTSTLANLYIGGDTTRFDGAVYAPNTTATLYRDARYTLHVRDQWTVDAFVNRGTLTLAASSNRNATPPTLIGNYSQRFDAVLRTQVLDQTHYGKLIVTGTASLPSQARIDVDVTNVNQPFTATRLNNVLSAGTLDSDGTFAVTGNSALFDFGAVKNGNAVDLTLAAKTSGSAQAAVARAGLGAARGAARVLDAQFAQGSASALTPYFVSRTWPVVWRKPCRWAMPACVPARQRWARSIRRCRSA